MANVYKNFRNNVDDNNVSVEGYVPQSTKASPINLGSVLSRRFDEPTYMSFRVMFGQNSASLSGTSTFNTNYDKMPHPLFMDRKVDSTITNVNMPQVEFNRSFYSTIDYLRDSNEFTRAGMLKEFITVWNNLQTNYQWYFQSIEGLNDLLNVVPERGKRVGKDVRLTFTMLEGIDQRISYLLNLYKKIAWDDTYQRWVLPDMMRFFDIQIYITEYRTFHQALNPKPDDTPLYLTILNDILPTYLIQCEMCEFDINSFNYSYKNKMSVEGDPETTSVSFKVKVGNINEVTTYPMFAHFIFNDVRLNGPDRSKEKGNMKNMNGRFTNPPKSDVLAFEEDDYNSTKDGDPRYAGMDRMAQDTYFQEDHISGRPFYEAGSYYSNLNNSNKNYSINLNMVDPIQPHTWVGNALNFGKSFAVNFITQKVDKAKMTKIPGLGFSFNEAYAAIQSKDFMSVFGLIRKAISQSIGPIGPSDLLNGKIDNTLKEFLTGLTLSAATNKTSSPAELELIKLAQQALNDPVTFQKIKDLSMATNMVSASKTLLEANTPVIIESSDVYKQSINTAIGTEQTLATDTKIKTEKNSVYIKPTTYSLATSIKAKDLQGKKYAMVNEQSLATDKTFIKTGIIITEGTPSVNLSKKIPVEKISVSASGLGEKIDKVSFSGGGELGNDIAKVPLTGTGELGSSIQKAQMVGNGGLGSSVQRTIFSGTGELGTKIQPANFVETSGLKETIEPIKLTGDGGLGNKAEGGRFNGNGGLGEAITEKGNLSGASTSIDNKINKASFSGDGGLGNKAEGGSFKGDGGLGGLINAASFSGDGGLGNNAEGGKITGNEKRLGSNVEGGKITGNGGLGNEVTGGVISGNGGLSNKVEGGSFVGDEKGLGTNVEGGKITGNGGLGSTIGKVGFVDNGGLGNAAEGGKLNTNVKGLGNEIEGGKLEMPEENLGNNIEGGKLTGAVDGLKHNVEDAKLNTAKNVSEATEKPGEMNKLVYPPTEPNNQINNNKKLINQPDPGKATEK
jgi:hypothetical protein